MQKMKVMNIWDLREVGFTHYQVRSIVEAVNNSDPNYAWVNTVLIREGMKKPKILPDLFLEAYRNFRLEQVEREVESIREKLVEFQQRHPV